MSPKRRIKYRRIQLNFPGLAVLFIFMGGCQLVQPTHSDDDVVTIAISKAVPEEAYRFYGKWLSYADSNVVWHDLYRLDLDSALALLSTCDGLLLTGGTDIYPARYGKERDTSRCWKPDFKRDTLETALLRAALNSGMPVMGICRGLQLINVELGGTLYIDLPEDYDTSVIHQSIMKYETEHPIEIEHPSLLSSMAGKSDGLVNSNHHQGIELLADELMSLAYTRDGLIEAIQLKDSSKAFLLGVQWHPERMDYANPMSGRIAKRFIREATVHSKIKKNEKARPDSSTAYYIQRLHTQDRQ